MSQKVTPLNDLTRCKRGSTRSTLTQEQQKEISQLNQFQEIPVTYPIIQMTQKHNQQIQRNRFDTFGNQIRRGQKKHKISFPSEQELEQVIYVENWKKYNADQNEEEETCPCKLI